MYQTYKPSGKTAGRFFLFVIICMITVVPAFSGIYTVLIWIIPSTIIDVIVYVICYVLMCIVTSKYCIKLGKVRSKRLAGSAAFIIFLWFSYLSLLFFSVLYQGVGLPQSIPLSLIVELVQNPKALVEALSRLLGQGYYFETLKSGTSGLLYQGVIMAVFWAIKCIISIIYIIFYFVDDSSKPFCESSKKWAAQHELLLEPIGDVEEFKKQLYFGNSNILKQADCLRAANSDHWEATLFVTEGRSDFYLTLVSKTRSIKTKSNGSIKFDEEDIVKQLSIDRDTGSILLNSSKTQDVTVGARLINSKARLQSRNDFIKTLIPSIIQVGILIVIIAGGDIARAAFSNVGVLFYLVLNVVVWAFNLWGSFIEENIIEDETDMLDDKSVSSYDIQKKSSPVYQKILYFVMLAVSLLLLIYPIFIV